MSNKQPFLNIKSLNIKLGKFNLHDVFLSCKRGEYHILLGPSGSGKSTLMKCILGFYKIGNGTIYLNHKNITNYLPEHRRMGYVPQNYALFPHLNVDENLKFPLIVKKLSVMEINSIVNELCKILKIQNLRKREVKNLSGGEKQKVALGRAICSKPDIILLDEPFSSIDECGKRSLWFELKQIVKKVGITTIHITHNLEEAYTLGENLTILIGGKVVQSGPKKEIFEKPVNKNIAQYLNYVNIYTGTANSLPNGTRIDLENFSLIVPQKVIDNQKVTVCIRQQDIKIVRENVPLKDSLKRNVLEGSIVELFPLPDFCLMWFRLIKSNQKYDMELKFPLHIINRHNLYPAKKVKVAIWEPTIILFK